MAYASKSEWPCLAIEATGAAGGEHLTTRPGTMLALREVTSSAAPCHIQLDMLQTLATHVL